MVAPDLFVCETVTADQLADFRVRVAVLAVQVQDACKLLGSPTSIALAIVGTEGRGV